MRGINWEFIAAYSCCRQIVEAGGFSFDETPSRCSSMQPMFVRRCINFISCSFPVYNLIGLPTTGTSRYLYRARLKKGTMKPLKLSSVLLRLRCLKYRTGCAHLLSQQNVNSYTSYIHIHFSPPTVYIFPSWLTMLNTLWPRSRPR